jgi:hypothetical protein
MGDQCCRDDFAVVATLRLWGLVRVDLSATAVLVLGPPMALPNDFATGASNYGGS